MFSKKVRRRSSSNYADVLEKGTGKISDITVREKRETQVQAVHRRYESVSKLAGLFREGVGKLEQELEVFTNSIGNAYYNMLDMCQRVEMIAAVRDKLRSYASKMEEAFIRDPELERFISQGEFSGLVDVEFAVELAIDNAFMRFRRELVLYLDHDFQHVNNNLEYFINEIIAQDLSNQDNLEQSIGQLNVTLDGIEYDVSRLLKSLEIVYDGEVPGNFLPRIEVIQRNILYTRGAADHINLINELMKAASKLEESLRGSETLEEVQLQVIWRELQNCKNILERIDNTTESFVNYELLGDLAREKLRSLRESVDNMREVILRGESMAFKLAARSGSTGTLQRLWEMAGSDNVRHEMLEAGDYGVFRVAASNGHAEVLQLLWDMAGQCSVQHEMLRADDYGAFNFAASNGHTQILKLLWDMAGSDNARCAMLKTSNYEAFASIIAGQHNVERYVTYEFVTDNLNQLASSQFIRDITVQEWRRFLEVLVNSDNSRVFVQVWHGIIVPLRINENQEISDYYQTLESRFRETPEPLSVSFMCPSREKRRIGMLCVDSRDKTEEEEERRLIDELFDTDEARERTERIGFYAELFKISDKLSVSETVDLEDFIKKVRVIEPGLLDIEVRDDIAEIKEKVSEQASHEEDIKTILKRPGVAEKARKVAEGAGFTYSKFLGAEGSKSQNVISKITSNREAMNHLGRLGKVSGWAMHGVMYKNLVGSILSGDAKGVVINLGFIGGSKVFGKLAEIVSRDGELLISDGKLFLGRSLKVASPFLGRVTSAFIIYDLVQQVKAYKAGNKDALAKIVGDNVVIAVDVAEIGIEVAEAFGVLEGVSSVTGPIGAAVGAMVFIGTDVYLAVRTVEKEDKIIHLTEWEKFKEGWRAFLNMKPEKYLEGLMEEKQINNQLVKDGIEFLKNATHFDKYVFPTKKSVIDSCRTVLYLDRHRTFLPESLLLKSLGGLVHDLVFLSVIMSAVCKYEECVTRLRASLDNTAFLNMKGVGVYSRAKPDNPEEGGLSCPPVKGGTPFLYTGEGNYYCHNAIGVSYSINRTGNYAYIALGDGCDQVTGFSDSPNIFLVENGDKSFIGGDKDDIFVLRGSRIKGWLDGGDGVNTVDLGKFALDKNSVDIDIKSGEGLRESEFSLSGGNLYISNMQVILGREAKQDMVKCACDTKHVDTRGGTSNEPDRIVIPECNSSSALEVVVRPDTTVNNLDYSSRSYSYVIFPGEGKADIELQPGLVSQQKHSFLFHSALSNLVSVDYQYNTTNTANTVKGVELNFGLSSKKFAVNISNVPTNVTYKLLEDNTEIKIGDKGNLYALQNTNKSVDYIIENYPAIANRLNMTIAVNSNGESVVVKHGKHEVLYSDGSSRSHLIGNGGENIYVVGRDHNADIYDINGADSIDTLDLREAVKNLRSDRDIQYIGPKISEDGDDLLIRLEIFLRDSPQLIVPTSLIRLKNGIQWCQRLHIILDSVPMQLEKHSYSSWSLKPIPLIFDESTEIAAITARDVEEGSRLVLHKQAGQYVFSRLRDDLMITTDPSLGVCTVLLSDFYREPKMRALSVEFNDMTISLQEKVDEVNSNKLIFCPSLLQVKKALSINGHDLLSNYDCLKFDSGKVGFYRSSNRLLLLSDQGMTLIRDYYSDVRGKWSLPIELSNVVLNSKEFRKKADNADSFKYYRPSEQGLRIYHNPSNKRDLGLIDLKDKSILDCEVKIENDSLVLLHKKNALVKVESFNTYAPAREIMFAFNDTSARCVTSSCETGDFIKEFQEQKDRIAGISSKTENSIANKNNTIDTTTEQYRVRHKRHHVGHRSRSSLIEEGTPEPLHSLHSQDGVTSRASRLSSWVSSLTNNAIIGAAKGICEFIFSNFRAALPELNVSHQATKGSSSSSLLSDENVALIGCIVDALDNTQSRHYQSLIDKGVEVVPNVEVAVRFACEQFDSFVEDKIRNLDSKEKARIRAELEEMYPEITESLRRGVEFSGNVGLDDVLEKCKECFCKNVLPKNLVNQGSEAISKIDSKPRSHLNDVMVNSQQKNLQNVRECSKKCVKPHF